MIDLAVQPTWVPVQFGYGRAFLVHLAGTDGSRITWHVEFNNFDSTGRRHNMAFYAWPDIPDPDVWDKPVLLHRRLAGAKDEFLLRVVHGWQPGYGFAWGEGFRAIYGRGGERRERRFIVAELSGRGVCTYCPKSMHVRIDGTLNAHNRLRSLDRCAGSHKAPAIENVLI